MPPEQRWRKRNKSFVNLINRDLRFTSARAFSPWEPRRLAILAFCQVKPYSLLAKGMGFSS